MKKSTDSRTLGPVKNSDILGRVVAHLPAAVRPLNVRYPWAAWLSYGLAGLLLILALVHLYRIDTLVPILATALNSNLGLAALITALIVSAEVFALPYLMMMRLSPLGHVASGLLAIIVPLSWLLIAIWTLGFTVSTGQLGEFVMLQSSWWLIILNALWLGASFSLLWLRRYDETFRRLRKPT